VGAPLLALLSAGPRSIWGVAGAACAGKYRAPVWPQPLKLCTLAHSAKALIKIFFNFNMVKL